VICRACLAEFTQAKKCGVCGAALEEDSEETSRVYFQFDENEQDQILRSRVLRWVVHASLCQWKVTFPTDNCSATSELKKERDLYERQAEAAQWSLTNMEASHSFNTELSSGLLRENSREMVLNTKLSEELKRWQNAIIITKGANHRIEELIEEFNMQVCVIVLYISGVHGIDFQGQIGVYGEVMQAPGPSM